MIKAKYSVIIVITGMLMACSSSKKSVVLDAITVNAKRGALDTFRATATRIWDITHTRVALSFNLNAKTADGRVWIDLHPYFYATDTLELDAKNMYIDTVLLVNGILTKQIPFKHQNDILKLRFEKVFTRNDSIRLCIKYTATPYGESTGGSKAITDDRGLYFINTDNAIPNKPVQIWTQGETESNSHWMPTIDKPNERFTTQIELTIPDSFTTLSNGYLKTSTTNSNSFKTDIWVMNEPIQTYAVMFTIGKYDVIKDEWRRNN